MNQEHHKSISYASNLAYAYLIEGRLEQSKVLFEGLSTIDKDNADYYFRALAMISCMQKQYRKAYLLLNRVVRRKPAEGIPQPLDDIFLTQLLLSRF